MLSSKSIMVILLIALGAVACSGAVTPVSKKPSGKARARFEKIDVPKSISQAERPSFEKTLFVLPVDHPGRLPLRDRLAESYARSFGKIEKGKDKKRLKIFESALALHDPVDFKPDRVAPSLVPMAKWMVARYEVLGDEALVLAGLRYLMLAQPAVVEHEQQYRDLSEWSVSVREAIEDDMDRYSSLGRLYLQIVQLVPERETVDLLADLLIRRHKAFLAHLDRMEREGAGMPPFLLRMLLQEGGMGKDMIQIYFLVGDPLAALDKLKGMGREAGVGEEHIELLEDLAEGDDEGEAYFALAGLLGQGNPRAALRACMAARDQNREDPRYPLCIGRAFERMGRPSSAVDYYLEAARTTPVQEVLAQSMEMVREALFEIHRLEQEKEAAAAIATADQLVDHALDVDESRGETVSMTAAALLFTCGVVEFDDGMIDSALAHFDRARKVWPDLTWALEKSAEISQMRGRHSEAVEMLSVAIKEMATHVPDPFWQAKLLEVRGNSYRALGDDKAATSDYREALVQWGLADIPEEQEPDAALRMGILHDRLGELPESTASFRRAIRLDPDRRSTYADLLSFLVIQKRMDDAAEFYMLAFNQDRIEAMWKIYYALWVDGLSRRMGKGPFELASGYLAQSGGDTWQDDLARHYSGRLDDVKLRKKITNKGQEVEADFYTALKLLGDGKRADALPLLKKVVESDLMGFFEYKMAREMLVEAR